MRDEQVRRYARHIALSDIGGLGQTALLVSAAKLPLRESEAAAELIAAQYLVAGGVGTVVLANATEAQLTEVIAHGPDSNVVLEGEGREVVLAPKPAWWPSAEGDAVALAYWRGSLAAAKWMLHVATR